MTAATWGIVVPVKRLGAAKSRLALGTDPGGLVLPPDVRAGLALAFAVDTIEAVLAAAQVARVVVVTSEDRLLEVLGARERCDLVADPGTGLDGAIERGRQALADADEGPAAILLGDLPALRHAELDAALRAASVHDRAMVADAGGLGTTLLTAASPADLRPRFGPGSRRSHEAAGHRVLDDVGPGLRRDVDTAADLEGAVRLGVGPRTARLLAELTVGLGLPPGPSRAQGAAPG